MKRRGVEAAIRLDRPAIPAEFNDMFSHDAPRIGWQQSLSRFGQRGRRKNTGIAASKFGQFRA
jgi:hypothetical protein